jgi:hypothetical protein
MTSSWPKVTGPVPGSERPCPYCGRVIRTFFLKNDAEGMWVVGWCGPEEVDEPYRSHDPERCRDLLKVDLDALRARVSAQAEASP